PRLDADLGRAEIARLLRAPHHLRDRQEVALLLAVVSAERAERAVLDADVREVDVAIDDVGHDVARLPPPELVGDQGERVQIAALGAGERHAVLDRHLVTVEGPREDRAEIARDPVERAEHATSDASVHGIPCRDRARRAGPGRAGAGLRPGTRRAPRTLDRSRGARAGRSPGSRSRAGARGSAATVSLG